MEMEGSISVGSKGTLVSLMSKEMELLQAAAAKSRTSFRQSLDMNRSKKGSPLGMRDQKLHKRDETNAANHQDSDRVQLNSESMEHRTATTSRRQSSIEPDVVANDRASISKTETSAIVWKGSIYIPPKDDQHVDQRNAPAFRTKIAYEMLSALNKDAGRSEGTRIPSRKIRKSMDDCSLLRPMIRSAGLQEELDPSTTHRKKSNGGGTLPFVDVVDFPCCYSETGILSTTFYSRLRKMNSGRLSNA